MIVFIKEIQRLMLRLRYHIGKCRKMEVLNMLQISGPYTPFIGYLTIFSPQVKDSCIQKTKS